MARRNNIKPKYVIWENVKNVLSKKHKHNFDKYLNKIEHSYGGYGTYKYRLEPIIQHCKFRLLGGKLWVTLNT